ncbi:MAG: M14 family metallopeptidase [Caulobacterales bacterium]|nr:M14 family metallopeptidase [Caulobacterales bacterium]
MTTRMGMSGLVAIVGVMGAASCALDPALAPPGACENDLAALDADFDGARLSACRPGRDRIVIAIAPEDSPINPSPWYAFRVTPNQPGELAIVIRYEESKHRYQPKISADGESWTLLDPGQVRERRGGRRAELTVPLGAEPFYVAGQEFLLNDDYDAWTAQFAEQGLAERRAIGASMEGRPITALFSAPAEPLDMEEVVVLIGRQHPPELTGAFAMLAFVETVFADTPLARSFRSRFHVIVAPNLNPDGVARGHWRHNVGGVDLNRDWGPFTQPETRTMLAVLDDIGAREDRRLSLLLDFHSTNRNVFYTQTSEDVTDPPGFTERWLAAARARLPDDYDVEHAERPVSERATSKNYAFTRFGAPAITYEVGDHTDRALLREAAVVLAEEMMRVLMAPPEEGRPGE